jgi:tetratricopeptide (TPR) repeat protein
MTRQFIYLLLILGGFGLLACEPGTDGKKDAEAATKPRTARQDTIAVLSKRIQANPNDPNLYYRRAKYSWEDGDTTLAMADIDRALSLEPDNADYLYQRGAFHYMRGQDKAAWRDLDEAVRLKVTNPDAYYLMGSIAYLRKDYAQALNWMDRAIKINDQLPIFYVGKALVYRGQGQIARAIAHANYALERDKQYLKALALLVDIHLNEQPDLQAARRFTYFMLEKDSLHPLARFNMGLILYKEAAQAAAGAQRQALLQKAIEQFNMAVGRDTRYANAYYMRGYMQQELGKLDAAEADYKQALKLNPKDHRAAFMLGSIYERYEEWEKARTYYKQAVAAKPDFADAKAALQDLAGK